MPSSLSHAMVAVAGAWAVAPRPLFKSFLIIGAICAVLPDIDFIGSVYGDHDGHEILGGHRGFTHSLAAAALVGLIATCATFASSQWRGYRGRFGLFVALATASHGVLDTLTTIGATTFPVQFFSPFSSRGYTSWWRPINGPFSELFFCLIPLILVTRFIWYRRNIPWPRRVSETPVTLGLAEQRRREDDSVESAPHSTGAPRRS